MNKIRIFDLIQKLQRQNIVILNGEEISINGCFFYENSINVFLKTEGRTIHLIKNSIMDMTVSLDGIHELILDYSDLKSVKGINNTLLSNVCVKRAEILSNIAFLSGEKLITSNVIDEDENLDIINVKIIGEFTPNKNFLEVMTNEEKQHSISNYEEMLVSINYTVAKIKYAMIIKNNLENDVITSENNQYKIKITCKSNQ
jgi:hypothetical protein